MRRLLIVTPRWIPDASPDMQRVRMSLPYYRENGWEPILLCVDPTFTGGRQEPELESTVPSDIRVYRCGALRPDVMRRLGIGSLGLRSWRHLRRAGLAVIEREQIDLVFLSTTEFVTLAAARAWRKAAGVPYVIDLQDPWRTSHYERKGAGAPPGGWKYQSARLLAWCLEERTYAQASAFISVSPHYLDALGQRYRWMATVPTAVIPFGASRRDLENLDSVNESSPRRPVLDHAQVNLTYTGTAGPVIPETVEILFTAFVRYQQEQPLRAKRFVFHFVGTSYATAGSCRLSIQPIAERYGIGHFIRESPARITHLESLRLQRESDALLLLGSADPAYSPSKLYPYFLSRRPILALARADSHLLSLLAPLGGAHLATFRHEQRDETTYLRLKQFFDFAHDGFPQGCLPPRNEAYFDAHFGSRELTARQCALFDQVTRGAQDGRSPSIP